MNSLDSKPTAMLLGSGISSRVSGVRSKSATDVDSKSDALDVSGAAAAGSGAGGVLSGSVTSRSSSSGISASTTSGVAKCASGAAANASAGSGGRRLDGLDVSDRRRSRLLCRDAILREAADQTLDLLVSRIRLEHALVPAARRGRIALARGDVAEVPQRDEVLGVERQRGLEHAQRFVQATALEQRLAVDDVAAHVARLLREILLADQDRLFEVANFAELIRQRGEVAARIFVELLFELVDAGGAGHQSLGGGAQAVVVGSAIRYRAEGTSQSEVPPSLDFSHSRQIAFPASLLTRVSRR